MSNDIYFYSAVKNAFFPGVLEEVYIEADAWPSDLIEVSDEMYAEFGASPPPNGKIMISGAGGLPEWVDIPPPTLDEYIAQAVSKKAALLAIATKEIAPLQDAVDFEEATEEEVIRLKEWKKYRITLTRIDTSTAPNIDWPEVPA